MREGLGVENEYHSNVIRIGRSLRLANALTETKPSFKMNQKFCMCSEIQCKVHLFERTFLNADFNPPKMTENFVLLNY